MRGYAADVLIRVSHVLRSPERLFCSTSDLRPPEWDLFRCHRPQIPARFSFTPNGDRQNGPLPENRRYGRNVSIVTRFLYPSVRHYKRRLTPFNGLPFAAHTTHRRSPSNGFFLSFYNSYCPNVSPIDFQSLSSPRNPLPALRRNPSFIWTTTDSQKQP